MNSSLFIYLFVGWLVGWLFGLFVCLFICLPWILNKRRRINQEKLERKREREKTKT
jgi:hypothetical protein